MTKDQGDLAAASEGDKPIWEQLDEIGRSVPADAWPEFTDLRTAVVEIERLRAELAALREDAERYRALRARRVSTMPAVSDPLRPDVTYTPDGLDAAIDDARRK